MKLTGLKLIEFEDNFFMEKHYGLTHYRYGQAICNYFIVPRDIEDKIFYEENLNICRNIIWEYALLS